jgi:V8-like Glu-specific endopeptidase
MRNSLPSLFVASSLLLAASAGSAEVAALQSAGTDELRAAVEERSRANRLRAKGVKIDQPVKRGDVSKALLDEDFSRLHAELRARQKLVYGVDDRLPIRLVSDAEVLANAGAVVALVKRVRMGEQPDGSWRLVAPAFKERGVCEDEPFREQPVAAFCSGFLIDAQTVVTAGHCVPSAADLASAYFVFGYRMLDDTKPRLEYGKDDVYASAELVARHEDGAGADWAIVKLERPVAGHAPVARYRRSGAIQKDAPVYVIGHPVGLPLIYADGAKVRDDSEPDYFVANLDTYGGNSGSMVVNASTHEVEGVLVRGETDFVDTDDGCQRSNVCPDTGCRGEDVTRITVFGDRLGGGLAAR